MEDLNSAMNPTTDEAIKYLKGAVFTDDMSPSTLRAIAINNMAIEALHAQNRRVPDTTGINPARLSEICAAEREGRLRILPCKVGDELCADYGDEGRETGVVTNIEINIETEMGVFWLEDIGVLVDVKKETANAKAD